MQIVVEELPAAPLRRRGTAEVTLAGDSEPEGFVVREPVSYDLTLTRHGSSVRIEGTVEATLEAACHRCAENVVVAVNRRFSEVFAPANERGGVLPAELDESDLDLDYYEGDAIDGLQLLEEQILLGLPMKILCAEGCKGLCVTCGADLNHTQCNCETDVDPRWSSLQGLRDRL